MDRDLDEFVAVVQTDANGGDPTKREIAAGILRTISELIAEREQNSITDAEFKDVVEHLKATYYPPKGEATNGTH